MALLERRAVIVGGGQPAEELIRALEGQPDNDIRICGIFDDRKDDRSPKTVAGYPKLGTIAELVDFGRIARVDLLIVSLPITAENRLLQLLKQLWVLPVDIRLSAHTNKLRFRPRTYSFVGTVPSSTSSTSRSPTGTSSPSGWSTASSARSCCWLLCRSWRVSLSRFASTAAGRCSSSRSATASTTS